MEKLRQANKTYYFYHKYTKSSSIYSQFFLKSKMRQKERKFRSLPVLYCQIKLSSNKVNNHSANYQGSKFSNPCCEPSQKERQAL